MAKLVLPFEWRQVKESSQKRLQTDLFASFPEPLKEACREMPHLSLYLHMILFSAQADGRRDITVGGHRLGGRVLGVPSHVKPLSRGIPNMGDVR